MQYSQTSSFGLGSGTGGALSGVPFGPLTAYPNIPVYKADGTYYTGQGGNKLPAGSFWRWYLPGWASLPKIFLTFSSFLNH
jgi:hypothetical protein